MEEYYPSEIARLVLGYLDEVKCTKSWQIFLEESGDLQEHLKLLKVGRKCSTNVRGESLLEILKAYCALKSFFEQIICQYSWREVLEDINYLQEHYNEHKQKRCYSNQKTGQFVVNSLKEWISKISSTSTSNAEQVVWTDYPCYSHSFIPVKPQSVKINEQNASQCDKSIQTDKLPSLGIQNVNEESTTWSLDVSKKRNESIESIIDSTSDKEKIQNQSPTEQQGAMLISEGSKNCANEHACVESLPFGKALMLSLLTPEKDKKNAPRNEKSPQDKNHQVKRMLFKDSSLSKTIHIPGTHSKSTNAENMTMKDSSGQLDKVSEVEKTTFSKADYSNGFSSNIDSNVTECADVQNKLSGFNETNRNSVECSEKAPCNLSNKESINQIPDVDETENSTINTHQVPFDNNSSYLGSEHDLEIVENELDHSMIDNEENLNNASCKTPSLHLTPTTENKPFSHETKKSSQKEDGSVGKCSTTEPPCVSSLDILCHSVENSAKESTDVEMIDKTDKTKENPEFVAFSTKVSHESDAEKSEKRGNCEVIKSTIVGANHDLTTQVVKSTDDSVMMSNSQNSSVISPLNQSNTVVSYTTVPKFTVPSVSSDLCGQNNIQYKIILNNPVSWNVPFANGLSLVPSQGLSFAPPLSFPNATKPTVFTPASTIVEPTLHVPNVAKQTAVQAAASHVANFETVITHNHENTKNVPVIKTKADSKKSSSSKQKDVSRKKQKTEERKDDKKKSKSTVGKRTNRFPKRKPLSLFSSSPKNKEATPKKIPVLSIAESPVCPGKSIGSKVIHKVTNEFEEDCKSPVLKLLMNNAKDLLKTNNTSDFMHIRHLKFNSELTGNGANDEIVIIDETEFQENDIKNITENVPEILSTNTAQNSKTFVNNSLLSERAMSEAVDKKMDCDETSKGRIVENENAVPSKDKKPRSQKQNKIGKRTDKNIKTLQKIREANASKIKKVKLLDSSATHAFNKKLTPPRQDTQKCSKSHIHKKNSDMPANIKKNISPRNSIGTNEKDMVLKNNAILVSQKSKFHVENFENENEKGKMLKSASANELHKKDTEIQDKKSPQKFSLTTNVQNNKTPSKNNEKQNKKCILDRCNASPRKSQRIINKMATSSNGFPIWERNESLNENIHHCKDNVLPHDKSSVVLQNATCTSVENNKVSATSKNYLSPHKNMEINSEYCKSNQNIGSARKSNRLRNKKTINLENTNKALNEKCAILNENEDQTVDGENTMFLFNKVYESLKETNIEIPVISLDSSHECIDIKGDSESLNTVLFENKNKKMNVDDKNDKPPKLKNKDKCMSEKNKKTYLEKDKETVHKNIFNMNELNNFNKSLMKSDELQSEKAKTDSKKNESLKNKEVQECDVIPKPKKETCSMQSITQNGNDKLKKCAKTTSNKDVEKSQLCSKMPVCDDSCEFKTDKNPDEKAISHKCNEIIVDSGNIELNRKNFHDKNFKIQIADEQEGCINDIKTIQTNLEKDSSNRNTSKEYVKIYEDILNSPRTKQKSKKGVESIISCTTIINKRKMTHPKKWLKQNYLDSYDVKTDVQDSIGKIEQPAPVLISSVPNFNSVEISNSSINFNDFNLELNCDKESNSKDMSNVLHHEFFNENSANQNMDDVINNIPEINSIKSDEGIPKDDSTVNLNVINISNPSITTSTISDTVSVESNLNINSTEHCLNEVNPSKSNLKEKLVTDSLSEHFTADKECDQEIKDVVNKNSDAKIQDQSSSALNINKNIAKVAENEALLHKEKKQNESELNTSCPESLNIVGKKPKNSSSPKKFNVKISKSTKSKNQSTDCMIDTDNLDSAKHISWSPSLSSKEINIKSVDHSFNHSLKNISSDIEEDSKNMNSPNHKNGFIDDKKTLEISQNLVNISGEVLIDNGNITNTSPNKRKLSESISDLEEMSGNCEDSPLSTKKRICRKLSSSSDEIEMCPERKYQVQKEISHSSEGSQEDIEVESLQVITENLHEEISFQNLDVKFKAAQDSPVRCLTKAKKILPKTALSRRIEKDPRIPAGVKLPYKWNNSKIITYSNEICKSTKISRKNEKNIPTETADKQKCLIRKQTLKPGKHKIGDKQNLLEKLSADYKLDNEPCVKLARLPVNAASLNEQHSLNTELKITDHNDFLDSDCEQKTEAISKENIEAKTVQNFETSVFPHTTHPQDIKQHSESTQDMVEADIGRSNDEGSELAVAIKNCEKELLSSEPTHPSQTPVKISSNQSEKEVTDPESSSKMKMIRDLVEKHGAEWILQQLDDLDKFENG